MLMYCKVMGRRDPQLLGLTQAEALALTALMRHGTIADAAESLGISYVACLHRLDRARKKSNHKSLIELLLLRHGVAIRRSKPSKDIDDTQDA